MRLSKDQQPHLSQKQSMRRKQSRSAGWAGRWGGQKPRSLANRAACGLQAAKGCAAHGQEEACR